MRAPELTKAGPTSKDMYERARRSLPGGNSRTTVFVPPNPPYAMRGDGARVFDVDGRELIDLQNNYTALVHGHAFPPVVAAATAAIANGTSFGLPTPSEVGLAELLASRMPWAPQWRFANSGTEAVMIALRAARAFTGRDGILLFEGCYHGSYDAVLAAGARGVTAAAQQDIVTVPVGDEQAFLAALDRHGAELAGVLLDLMPNRAGLRPADPQFVATVREQTRRRGILLIVDEVITFRMALGGMQQIYGLRADLTTLGKSIGGGFPVGALGGPPDVMAVFDPLGGNAVGHGGTFTANPVTMSAGAACLHAFDEAAIDRINLQGDRLRGELVDQGYTVTGTGSLLRLHTTDTARLWWQLYEQGVLVTGNGLACLSTAIDDATLGHVSAAFARVAAASD